jgi:hypothetical protein
MKMGFLSKASILVLTLGSISAGAADKKPRKVIRLDSITVEGRIQKPQAFLLLQRSSLNFEELERTESFIPKVIKSVDSDPF